MNTHQLFRLPNGTYSLTDTIYNYTLEKYSSNELGKCYRIKVVGSMSGSSIFFCEKVFNDNGDKYKGVSAHTSVGGLSIHTENIYFTIKNLNFKPNKQASFSDFFKSLQ